MCCCASQKVMDRGDGLETHADDVRARIARLFGGEMQFDVCRISESNRVVAKPQ
jgi:hypothetical protein